MSQIRTDDFGGAFFHRENGAWTVVDFFFEQGITDGTDTLVKRRVLTFQITDLPAAVLTPLGQAWTALQAYRDSVDPLP